MAGWYYSAGGQQQGPVSREQLQQMLASGQVQAGELVWTEGMPNWQPAHQVPGLVQMGAPAPAPAPGYGAPQPGYGAPPQQGGYGAPPGVPGGYGAPVGYVTPGGYGGPVGQSYKGMAIGGFVCAIVGLFAYCGGIVLGILALIFCGIALSGMGKSGNPDGKGMAVAGLVIGILDLVGWGLMFIIYAASMS